MQCLDLKKQEGSQVHWLTAVIPGIGKVEIGWISIPVQLGQKVSKNSSKQISQVWQHTPVIQAMQEA
jgi:hypothetical protein